MEPEMTCMSNDTTEKTKLYMAMELSQKEWKLGFSVGPGQAPRLRSVGGVRLKQHRRRKWCDYRSNMTRRRWILIGLLVVAVGLSVVYMIKPDEGLEILCLVFTVPVVVVNMWEWGVPEIVEKFFGE